jgi:hypothetical protein
MDALIVVVVTMVLASAVVTYIQDLFLYRH